jgi:hypothetical protein
MDKPKLNCIVRWIIFPVVVVILFILMVVFLLLESYVAPVLKGFHCNDITISYAYYSHQTVPTWALFVIVLAVSPFVVNIVTITITYNPLDSCTVYPEVYLRIFL